MSQVSLDAESSNAIAGRQWSGPSLWSSALATVVFTTCIIRFKVSCVSCGIWSSGLGNGWYELVGCSLMIFSVLPKICNPSPTDEWRVSGFRFLSHLWSNVSVGYITVLLLVFKSSSFDPYLKLLIVDKGGVSRDFNQSKKERCCR